MSDNKNICNEIAPLQFKQEIIEKFFVNRSDTYLLQDLDGSYLRCIEPLSNHELKLHLTGSKTIAIYQLDSKNNCVKWICFDIDPGRIKNSTEKAIQLCNRSIEFFGKKSVLLEASRHPDESYHIWCFFDCNIPAFTAKYIGKRILEDCKLEKDDIELFPKQTQLRKNGYGNAVKLPLGVHRKYNKKSVFLNPDTLQKITEIEAFTGLTGTPTDESLIKRFNAFSSGTVQNNARILGDYFLNHCGYEPETIWNLLQRIEKEGEPRLIRPVLEKIMRESSDENITKNLDKKTSFSKQNISLDEKTNFLDVPCVKWVLETPIPPSRRHDVLGKNFSILYYKLNGNFDKFDVFTKEIIKNQKDFDDTNFDWSDWVLEKPRTFNCIEVKNFLQNTNIEFSCHNCPLKIETYYIPTSGGITEFFVFEPISSQEYVYKTITGKRGICKVNKVEKMCSLNIEGQTFFLKTNPPKNWFFERSKKDAILNWVSGKKISLPLHEIWNQILVEERVFLDLPNENDYYVLSFFVIQSWISEFLETVFYCSIQGEWGGGKTVCGEAIIQMCRHGYSSGSMTRAFIARAIEEQKLSMFSDEIDSTTGNKDSHIYQLLRQGYRRGTPYSVVNPNTLNIETFDVFGPKIFSLHSSLEPALQSRTIPIHTQETEIHEIPMISNQRKQHMNKIRDELFFWYLDNAFNLKKKTELVDRVDSIDVLEEERNKISFKRAEKHAQQIRKVLFAEATRDLTESQLNQLKQLRGRNLELGQILMRISNLVNVDLNNEIREIFEQKAQEEELTYETGHLGFLKEVLINLFNEKRKNREYLTEEGFVKISNREIFERYVNKCKQNKQDSVSNRQLTGLLSEFGFQTHKTRKKMKVPCPGEEPQSRLCCIFTPKIQEKIGLKINELDFALKASEDSSSSDVESGDVNEHVQNL